MSKKEYKEIIEQSLEDWKHLAAVNTKNLMENLCNEYQLQGIKNIVYRGTVIYKKEIKKKNRLAEININKEKDDNGTLVFIKDYKLFI